MTALTGSIQQYIKSCNLVKRLDAKTLKAYRCDLEQFDRWLQLTKLDFSRDSLVEHVAYLNTIYSPGTVKRKTASIKAFANYREAEGLCPDNPFRLLKIVIKEPKRLPKTISVSKLDAIFEAAYAHSKEAPQKRASTYLVRRNQLMLELMIATGMRVSEICNLDLGDLDLCGRLLRISGKGSKERVIQLEHKSTLNSLERYLDIRGKWVSARENRGLWNEAEALLLTKFGKRISEQAIREVVSGFAQSAGVHERITPHMFRHTFATLLLEKDVDIRYIQQLLGHSSITTTTIYTHVASSKLRAILQVNNPRDSISVGKEAISVDN